MKRWLLWVVILFFVFVSTRVFGAEVFLRAYQDKVISSAVINETAEVCSDALSVSRSQYLSVQWNAVSATGVANVRVYVIASIDGTNFVVPEGVADVISSDVSEAWRVSGVYIPMVGMIKVCVKGVAANPADTITNVWLGRQ